MSWNAMKKRLWVLIVLCLGAAVANAREGRTDSNVIHADLAFHFVWKEKDRSTVEDDIDNFLRRQGFKVLNQGRIQRTHGFFLTELKIIGLDDGRRLIDVTAMPSAQGRYAVRLTTPPPTERAPQLEEALLEFASKILGCEVRQIIRGENAADAAEFYNNENERVENLFRQAERLQGERRL